MIMDVIGITIATQLIAASPLASPVTAAGTGTGHTAVSGVVLGPRDAHGSDPTRRVGAAERFLHAAARGLPDHGAPPSGEPYQAGRFSRTAAVHIDPGPGPHDARLRARIADALARSPDVRGYRIDVHVRDGTAYLHGHVGSPLEKRRALEVARRVPGVRRVIDSLVAPTRWTWEQDWPSARNGSKDAVSREGTNGRSP